ncbi:hypothetical protein CDL12_07876 [Handroanthus impetiginosus]|uniref:Uncharacterized protein n=1 Tax=Handroanthus impetiginosus TaxID=429701 RepID=A0A2G9HPS3_9LAMI|nr:hypothetical protein CDL12_07876 [Handroanthus impetiginosus]
MIGELINGNSNGSRRAYSRSSTMNGNGAGIVLILPDLLKVRRIIIHIKKWMQTKYEVLLVGLRAVIGIGVELRYKWSVLFERSIYGPMLQCVLNEEVNCILKENCEGCCGSHVRGMALDEKVKKAGYLWPTMLSSIFSFYFKTY